MKHHDLTPWNETAPAGLNGSRLPPQPQTVKTFPLGAAGGLEERLQFESLLAGLSATFVNLAADQVDGQIQDALRQVITFLGADRGALAEWRADPPHLAITHSYHLPGIPPNPPGSLDARVSWYARVIYQGKILRFGRLPEDLPPEAVQERAYCLEVGLKSHVMIPLKVHGSVVGAIGFASFRGYRDWTDDLVRRLRLVGEVLTNALARKRADEALKARERSLHRAKEGLRLLAGKLIHAQEEERRRLAREMHDDWTQRLALLGIDFSRLDRVLANVEQARPLLWAMQAEVVALSEDVHDLSRQLHPAILEDLGLVEALRSECASFRRREGIAVDYRPGAVPAALPEGVALCLYRIAQEALRNVAKHAAVAEADLSLGATAAEVILTVADRGAGFDPAAPRHQPGLGVAGMEERVRLLGGTLTLTSAPGRGTTVEARFPLARGAS